MSRAWRNGSTRRWRTLRALILDANRATNAGRCGLALDGAAGRTVYRDQLDRVRLCPKHPGRACDAGCTRYADTAHHTRGRAVTGDDPRFIMATCAACNAHVGEPATVTPTVDPPGRAVTRW